MQFSYPLTILHAELIKGNMCSGGENILHMSIHPLQNCEVKLLGTVLIQLRQWFPCLLLLLLLRHFLLSFFLFFHLPNPKLLQTTPSTTTKKISSRNKNQTKEEEKPPGKKISLPNPFLSFSLSLPLSLFSPATHQEEETQTKTRTSLCPSPHGVQSFTALGKQANPNFRPIQA